MAFEVRKVGEDGRWPLQVPVCELRALWLVDGMVYSMKVIQYFLEEMSFGFASGTWPDSQGGKAGEGSNVVSASCGTGDPCDETGWESCCPPIVAQSLPKLEKKTIVFICFLSPKTCWIFGKGFWYSPDFIFGTALDLISTFSMDVFPSEEPAVRWIREGKFIKWESNPRCRISFWGSAAPCHSTDTGHTIGVRIQQSMQTPYRTAVEIPGTAFRSGEVTSWPGPKCQCGLSVSCRLLRMVKMWFCGAALRARSFIGRWGRR